MAAMTAQEITAELEDAWREIEGHGSTCDCCQRETPDKPGLRHTLRWEAYYAVDRYRPNEVLTDETDDSIEELVGTMVDAALVAVHETITRMAAGALGGKLYRTAA